jgi:hypothetical protein
MALTSTGAGDYTGDGTSGIYIYGAQLSDSASVDPYVYNAAAAPVSIPVTVSLVPYTEQLGPELVDASVGVIGSTYAIRGTSTAVGAGYYTVAGNDTLGAAVASVEPFLTFGKYYRLTLEIASVSGSSVSLHLSSAQNSGLIPTPFLSSNVAGTYTALITPDIAGRDCITALCGALGTSITFKVSVKEYLGTTATGTVPKGLLIEEQRTNLLLRSEEFENAAWGRIGTTVVANTVVSPDGSVDADTLTASAGTASHLTQQQVTTVASQTYTYSVFAKYNTAKYLAFGFASGTLGSAWAFVTVDIQNGTITQTTNGGGASVTATGAITPVGNGWYRITVTGNYSQTNTYPTFHIVNTSTPSFGAFGVYSWTAAGTESVYVWGAQLEAGAFATSYIPTVASQVTRAADNASMIGNNFAEWYNQTEGTLFGDVVLNSGSVPADQLVFQVDNGSNDQRHKISRYAAVFYGTTRITGSTVVDMSLGTANGNTAYKVDYAYKVNDFAGTSNAGTVATDTSGAVPVPLTTANIGRNGVGGEFLNGTIKRIAYYPRRLANTELQGITS